MNPKILRSFFVIISGLVCAAGSFAQTNKVEFPAPSPACTLKQRVGLTDIEIVYSRPGVKGRSIFGGLVPYGAVWRTGANNATKLTFSTAVKLNGAEIPAGTYALFTIPGEKEWTIIINKGAAQWGAFQYDEKADVVRFKATPVQLAETIETFTIEFNGIRDESARLDLIWDKTVVPIKLEVELAGKLVPQIEAVMASDEKNKPYYPGGDVLLRSRAGFAKGQGMGGCGHCRARSALHRSSKGENSRQAWATRKGPSPPPSARPNLRSKPRTTAM